MSMPAGVRAGSAQPGNRVPFTPLLRDETVVPVRFRYTTAPEPGHTVSSGNACVKDIRLPPGAAG
jgi:hypothetical protein